MKTVTVQTEWRAYHQLEVPEDWEWDGTLAALLEFDDLDTSTAELVDWKVSKP